MQRVLLESFDVESDATERPSADYSRGFQEGLAAAEAATQELQATLEKELVQSISDLAFKYEEVRSEIIQSLGPLFSALAEKVFPQCLADGFADQIAALLATLAAQKTGAQFHLAVPPRHCAAVASAAANSDLEVTISEDETLGDLAALISYQEAEWHVDGDQLLRDIQSILTAAQNDETRRRSNVRPNRHAG